MYIETPIDIQLQQTGSFTYLSLLTDKAKLEFPAAARKLVGKSKTTDRFVVMARDIHAVVLLCKQAGLVMESVEGGQ